MIKNDNNIQLNAMEETALQVFHSVIADKLGEESFTISIEYTEGDYAEKYLKLDLPLKPEDGEKIDSIDVTMKDGVFCLEYFKHTKAAAVSLGCIVANEINSNLATTLPITCIYSHNEEGFFVSALIFKPTDIIYIINGVLLALEYLILLEGFISCTAPAEEVEKSFDAIAAGGGYISSRFENFNIVK